MVKNILQTAARGERLAAIGQLQGSSCAESSLHRPTCSNRFAESELPRVVFRKWHRWLRWPWCCWWWAPCPCSNPCPYCRKRHVGSGVQRAACKERHKAFCSRSVAVVLERSFKRKIEDFCKELLVDCSLPQQKEVGLPRGCSREFCCRSSSVQSKMV